MKAKIKVKELNIISTIKKFTLSTLKNLKRFSLELGKF